MRLTCPDKKTFIAECSYEERMKPKQAGFRFNPDTKQWYTLSLRSAARLREYADDVVKRKLNQVCLQMTPWLAALPSSPCEDPFLDFQLKAIHFALSRNHSYLALDPGLGKTICAAGIMNAMQSDALYLCPPFLAENVAVKMIKWRVTKTAPYIFSDCQLDKHGFLLDNLKKYFKRETGFPLLFVDEAHRYKNEDALRTKYLFEKIAPHFEKVVCLSGTPMPNARPMELFPVLSNLAYDTIGFIPKFDYGLKYCAGFKDEYAWNFNGASNVEELAHRIKDRFLLRVKEPDVKTDIPEKREELVFLSRDIPPAVKDLEKKILKKYSPEDVMQAAIGEEHVSRYRHLLGIHKAKFAVPYLSYLLEEFNQPLLVFAIHKLVIEKLQDGLKKWNPLVITGDVPAKDRQAICDRFQKDSTCKILIGNVQAMGVGFDLTKAQRVVFAEFDWVPAVNEQAYKRAHRIGQTKSLLVQYLVFTNSIDRTVLETNMRKSKIIRKI